MPLSTRTVHFHIEDMSKIIGLQVKNDKYFNDDIDESTSDVNSRAKLTFIIKINISIFMFCLSKKILYYNSYMYI